MSDRRDYIALEWLSEELRTTLSQCAAMILDSELHGSEPESLEPLSGQLHQVQGSLQMIEFSGAALLLEEMEAAVRGVIDREVSVALRSDLLKAVAGACKALPDYFESLRSARCELPVDLILIFNELRAARGGRLLSSGLLFAAQLPETSAAEAALQRDDASELLSKLHKMYQMALKAYLLGDDSEKNLGYLHKVCSRVARLQDSVEGRLLWQAGGTLLEAMLADSLPAGAVQVDFLHRLEREIRQSRSDGGAVTALLDDLVFYALCGGQNSASLNALCEAQGYADGLRTRSSQQQFVERARLRLVAALRDLSAELDDGGEVSRLGERLAGFSDAMAILGLIQPLYTLRNAAAGIDSHLEGQRLGLSRALARIAQQLDESTAEVALQLPLTGARRDLISGARVVLADVQEALMSFVAEDWQHDYLQPLPQRLGDLADSLASAEMVDAAAIIRRAGDYIAEQLIAAGKSPDWPLLDALADAMTSVDYYLERSVDGQRGEDRELIRVAAECVARLGYPMDLDVPDNIIAMPRRDLAIEEEDIPDLGELPSVSGGELALDPDVLDIFIEEAGDVQALLGEKLPRWRQGLASQSLLAEVRRAFHTLKGSGRMAGAEQCGDYGWAIENMLNKVVDGHFTMDEARLEVVERALQLLPELIEELSQKRALPEEKLTDLLADAAALSREQAPALSGASPNVPESERDELTAVFIGEAEVHLRQVEEFLSSIYSYPVPLSDELQRALHTLKGSSKMAEVWAVASIITPLEGLVKEARAMRIAADESLVMLITDVLGETRKLVQRLRHSPTSALEAPALLRERIEAAEAELMAKAEADDVQRQSGQIAPGALNQFLLTYGEHLQHLGERLRDPVVPANAAMLVEGASVMGHFAQRAEDIGSESTAELAQALQVLLSHSREPLAEDYLLLVERALEQLMDDLNQLAAEQSATVNTELLEQLRDFDMDAACDRASEGAVEQSVEGEPEAAADEDEDDIDPEILEIFMEEARDLLEGLDTALHSWSEDRDNGAYLDDILRYLHTFKGGARLTGLSGMGDFAHQMETEISEALAARVVELPALLPKVQRAQDQLVKMLEELGLAPVADVDGPEEVRADAVGEATLPAAVADKAAPQLLNPMSRAGPQEMIKVPSELLERLINLAGETSIARGRIEEQVSEVHFSLEEMEMTVERLQEQVRRLDMETEAQIIHRQEQMESEGAEGFDPLEFDRYSQLQQLSRALLESASDLVDLRNTVVDKSRDMETLLLQQSRVNTELQEGLMHSQMVHFSRMVPRLRRGVRQLCGELAKDVDFKVYNAEGEMDRRVLERILPALEHMLRNAIDHGIETAERRRSAGKAEQGEVTMRFDRQGGDVVITISDDGAGIDLDAVRGKAEGMGLMAPGAQLSERQLLDFIFHAGFSTADNVTQISGRGVGMDVVHSEIKQLGGSIEVSTTRGSGSRFEIRLPFTVSVNRALMVSVGGEVYAVPLNNIEGILRVSPYELEVYYEDGGPDFEYAGQQYNLRYMGQLLGVSAPHLDGQLEPKPVLLIRNAEPPTAVQVDSLMGSREVVVKSLGPQFSAVPGLSGATVLGDGSVVVILDMLASIRADAARRLLELDEQHSLPARETAVKHVMVVDDSVTVRKVTSRLLERQQMKVTLARDGLEAVNQLQEMEQLPDVMLLDIEMPRMDGFEVASRLQSTPRFADIAVIMISSRTGQKHRQRASALGVTRFLGKPYQEIQLLKAIEEVLSKVEAE
ncbi:Hpt domain-containing protein [Spongiibacter sp.]|uniref:hybrid sensor histidine kinase/response regulator n=1 Tax=Spongiibacter sp. TaxID=2024860 RepID=UPI0035657366